LLLLVVRRWRFVCTRHPYSNRHDVATVDVFMFEAIGQMSDEVEAQPAGLSLGKGGPQVGLRMRGGVEGLRVVVGEAQDEVTVARIDGDGDRIDGGDAVFDHIRKHFLEGQSSGERSTLFHMLRIQALVEKAKELAQL